ncbi:MAG TPA: hypothetical protein VMA72_21225 [Streptosporangiaceae bacterium]|nr:hypothetical protein [Streptosporangiaceae bacterium]
MTHLEERLRRGMKDYSERVRPEAIRPLREPSRARRSRVVRWLAPAMAAVAVTGVIVGVSLSGQRTERPGATQPGQTRGSALKGMPRYYVTVFETYAGSRNSPIEEAVVHDSATGAALSSVRVPLVKVQGGYGGPAITAAANDRTFVVLETGTTSFFRLRVAADGRSVTRSRLRIGGMAPYEGDSVALSPDGTQLAMQVQHCPHKGSCEYTGIRIVTLASGVAHSWTTREAGAPFVISWVGNDQVAFEWEGQSQSGYRLLNVSGPGGNLLASRPIASPQPEPTDYTPAALVTANGRTVFTSNVKIIPDGHGTNTVVARIMELDARTGRLLRVLRTVTVRGVSRTQGMNSATSLSQACNVLSLAPSGVHLLVACYAFGRLDGNVFTPLPGFPSPSASGLSQQTSGAW